MTKIKDANFIIDSFKLPKDLIEISALTWYDFNKLAIVQDEKGIIFIYNLVDKKVERKINFQMNGDYEGVEYVNGLFYVLKSNGDIFQVTDEEYPIVRIYETPLKAKNDTEGLCYNKKNNSLLVLCKESPGKEIEKKKKAIYEFSLDKMKLEKEPIILIDLPSFLNKKDQKLYKPSGLTISTNNELILVDSKIHSLLRINFKGKILNFTKLDKKNFPQPEGICFSPEGKLYISSEGKNHGFLYEVKYQLN